MIRQPARLALTAAALALAAPLAAQEGPGTFSLPSASPSPTPVPAGPADERAGVAIPPQAAPTATPSPVPTAAPSSLPTLAPQPAPTTVRPAAVRPAPAATPTDAAPAPDVSATGTAEPLTLPQTPPTLPGTLPGILPDTATPSAAPASAALPEWWPYAAGGLGALALIGAAALLWRRRKPRVLRLAAPAVGAAADDTDAAPDFSRLDLVLEITGATRSLMRFTLAYRLTIANRSNRAVNDLSVAVQIACARASGGGGPSAGSAQGLASIARIGPHQAQSITGEVQLPLSAIQPLRQGTTPLFIPLVHVTVEGEGQRALARTFVVGPRSASGRVHPIALDQPPGGIAGLVAQSVAAPPASAAA